MDDIVESSKPPKPPRPSEPSDPEADAVAAERRRSLLLHIVALAAVVIAVSTGIIAWETHQERVFNKNLYCGFNAGSETGPQAEELSEKLGC